MRHEKCHDEKVEKEKKRRRNKEKEKKQTPRKMKMKILYIKDLSLGEKKKRSF